MKKGFILLMSGLILLTGCTKKTERELGDITTELPKEVVDRENKVELERQTYKRLINRLDADELFTGYTEQAVPEDSNENKKHTIVNIEKGGQVHPVHVIEFNDPDDSEYISYKTEERYTWEGKGYKIWAHGGTILFADAQEIDPAIKTLLTDTITQ